MSDPGWPEITPDTWIIVPNWGEYQHYKNRDPVWIKAHIKLLSNPEFLRLSVASKGVLLCIWLAYARTRGRLRYADILTSIGHGRGVYPQVVSLNHAGFIEFSASKPLAPNARARTRSGEVEVEKETPSPLTEDEQTLMAAAVDYIADKAPKDSAEFDTAIDALERDHHVRLSYTLQAKLWEVTRKREGQRP